MSPAELNYILNHGQFIEDHIYEDPFLLSLKYSGEPQNRLLIEQIQARQKIKKKLPEWYDNPDLIFPPGLSLEQASSQATATLKASLVKGNHLLDITGGLGIDCCYLSKSFNKATYVECDADMALIASHNFHQLNLNIEAMHNDGLEVLKNSEADFIYIDPYRRDDAKNKVVALSDCLPDVTKILDLLIAKGRRSLIKASPMLDINLAIEQLKYVCEVWIISHKNECKEVLFLLEAGANSIKVKTFDIYPETDHAFEFERNDVPSIKAETGAPDKFLYEPNASILKSGGQDVLAQALKIKKLHPNSNFFTSSELVEHFPGKTFVIKQQLKPFDKSLSKGRFNVISRNFPKKANEIEQKMKIKPAKNDYLIATRLQDGTYTFIVCELYNGVE